MLFRYFSALILVEGMEIDSLHERLLDDRKEEHKFAGNGQIRQVNPSQISFILNIHVYFYLTMQNLSRKH